MKKNGFKVIEVSLATALLVLMVAMLITVLVETRENAIASQESASRLVITFIDKGTNSREPVNLGDGCYYLSGSITNPSTAISALVKETRGTVIRSFRLPITTSIDFFQDRRKNESILLALNEIGLINGYLVFIQEREK